MDANRFSLLPTGTNWVAVCIEATGTCTQHVGIVYRDAALQLHKLHFAWHRRLMDESCPRLLACSMPNFDPADELFVAAYCAKIARTAPNRAIPYNLKIDERVSFDPATGDVVFGNGFTGLSCSTFVAAVFRSAGNNLVSVTGWPPADAEDIEVQTFYVEMLEKSRNPEHQAHGHRIRSEIGTPRIRPYHVAGACLENKENYPVPHSICDSNGRWILSQM